MFYFLRCFSNILQFSYLKFLYKTSVQLHFLLSLKPTINPSVCVKSGGLWRTSAKVVLCTGMTAGMCLKPGIGKLLVMTRVCKPREKSFLFSSSSSILLWKQLPLSWKPAAFPFLLSVEEKCFVIIRQNYFPYFIIGRSSMYVNDLSAWQLRKESITFCSY